MNIKLEQLVKEYKQTNSKDKLNKIFSILKPLVLKKAHFVYSKKFYPLSLYHHCIECRECRKKNLDIIKEKNNKLCENCTKCTCVKGTFNLKRNNLCEYLDIENDLWIEILRIIKNYDTSKSFDTYLYAVLWEWTPSFITKNFVKSLLNQSLEGGDGHGNIQIDGNDFKIPNKEEILSLGNTEIEKKVLSILLQDNRLKQVDIAKKIGISQQAVSKILKKIRAKIKNKL